MTHELSYIICDLKKYIFLFNSSTIVTYFLIKIKLIYLIQSVYNLKSHIILHALNRL
jgi:hypothetical protein